MYREYFGLEKRPFVLSPDPDFLYMSRIHDLALTHLEYGIVHNVGFLALTGDVGAGKTTLLKFLFEKVKDSLDVAMIFNTNLSPQAFLEMLVREFELALPTRAKSDLFEVLSEHFLKQYTRGRRCVIMVDEAQNLPDETFEELRMLSNLEIGSDFLLQIMLVGQPQLRERLSEPSLAQLTQRISVYYHLSGLSRSEVAAYITHRLEVAGSDSPGSIFEEEAVKYIAELSGGIPRIINSVCDASLTYAYADDVKVVSKELVEKVAADNELLALSSVPVRKSGDGGPQGDAGKLPEVSYTGPAVTDEAMSRLYGRIEGLEMRIKALESMERDRLSEMFQEMLSREMQKNIALEKKMTALSIRYKALKARLDALAGQAAGKDTKKKEKRFWEVFGGRR